MKSFLNCRRILTVAIVNLMAAHLASAATFEWNGSVDDFWATVGNWTPSGPPGSADSAVFDATDTVGDQFTINNVVGTSTTVAALSYTNSTSGTWHVTEIPAGNTLTVNGAVTVGGGTANGLVTSAAMIGGGTFVANGTPFNVGNNGSSSLDQNTILNLSGLSNFVYNAAAGTIATGTGNRSVAGIVLAGVSNNVTVGTINLNTSSSSSSGNSTALRLGDGTNVINAGTINVGAGRSSATVNFLTASGGLRLRGTGGTDTDRVNMTLGNRNSGSSSPATATGTLALDGHPVDMKIGTLALGAQNRAGSEAGLVGAGVFQFDQGTVDVTTINMGVCVGNSPTAGARGTLTVGANGTLTVGNISMANVTSPGVGANATGNLNILGGVVNCAGNIVKSTANLSTNNITIDTGGRLYMGSNGRIGTPALPTDTLTMSDATLRLSPGANATNVVVTTLTTGGAGNIIEIGSLPSISSYPVTFRLIKYDGTIQGAGYNFSIAGLPGAYTGSLVDNSAQSAVDLVITAGPIAQAITWNGNLSDDWDILTTKNWRLGANSTNYFDGDFVTFDDTAFGATAVDLTTDVLPGSLTVNNSTLSYSFNGSGKIGGLTGLTKQGSGTLVVNNTGVNDFGGPIAINAGTLQVGNGGTSGNLGSGALNNNASLIFNRSDDTTLPNIISGAASGSLTKNGAGVLTLSAANTFTGAVTVVQGILKAGNASALGRTNGSTTINSGATLDVNDLNLGLERVIVSGSGVGGLGAIVENTGSGAFNQANLAFVTLVGDTTFGGTGRWDLRSSNTGDPSLAALSTGGQPYKLTKVGPAGVYFPGVTVDPALGDVDVMEGTLAIESATTGLGNPASNLIIRAGATLQIFNMTNLLDKVITLNGSGTNNTVNNASGSCTVIGPMNLVGDCIFNAGGTSLTLSNAISGSGSLIKVGGAILTLAGDADGYAGNTTVSNGTLVVNNLINGGGTLTTLTNTILSGTGTNTGPVIVGGTLAPGTSAGTFGSGALTLNSGATLQFELNSVTTIGNGVNDLINVTGNLTVNNNTINIMLLGTTLQAGTYRLINYTGSLSGTFNPTVTLAGGVSHYGLTLDTTTPGQVNLIVSGSAARLVWTGAAGTAWDIGTSLNWLNTGTTLADVFYQADSVLLDDTASGFTLDIDAAAAVAPSAITNNSVNSFTINGPGRITGGTSIVKRGDGTLAIASFNDFTGVVQVDQGTLQAVNSGALGATTAGTIVASGATLDVGSPGATADNTKNLGTEPITVSGDGVGGAGAIVNNATRPEQNAVRVVTLAGNTTFGGSARWDFRGTGAALSTGGNAYNITKTGGNQISLVGASVDAALGDIDVQQGTFSIETTTTSAGDPNKTIAVQPGATLQMFNLTVALNKRIAFTNANFNNDSGANVIIGPVILDGVCTFDVDGGTSLTLSNTVSGPAGSLTKIETGTLILSEANTYGGDTTVNAGTLALLGSSSIANSPNLTLGGTAILDVSARTDGKLTIPASRTLLGNGRINGSLQVDAGGTVSPGNESLGIPIGALIVTNAVTLAGTNIMQTDKSNLTNDVIRGAASIAFAGTLVISDAFAVAFADGDVFKLFDAGSYSGSFTIEPATPGTGLFWDTSELNTSGTLKVVSTAPPPTISSVTRNGNNLVLAGSGGSPNGAYSVLTSTNVALPVVTSWSVLGTANFDASGNFSFPTPINPNTPQQFYLLRVP